MITIRVIPCLLLQGKGLVKTVRFKNPVYIGDPINAVRIFNELEVDEIIFLDINASKRKQEIQYQLLEEIANECFMPFCYGGGIRSTEQIQRVLKLGAEKVAINSYAIENPGFIKNAAQIFGSQSIVVSMDVNKSFYGKDEIYTLGATRRHRISPIEFARQMEKKGAGEILINSIARDGKMQGYDLELLTKISKAVNIPVIACGGAGNPDDLRQAVKIAGVSAVAAGSMFVYYGKQKGVLINYPDRKVLDNLLK